MKYTIIATRTIRPLKFILSKNDYCKIDYGNHSLRYNFHQKHTYNYFDSIYIFDPKYISRPLEDNEVVALKLMQGTTNLIRSQTGQQSDQRIDCIIYQSKKENYDQILYEMETQKWLLNSKQSNFNNYQFEALLHGAIISSRTNDLVSSRKNITQAQKLIRKETDKHRIPFNETRNNIKDCISNFEVIDMFNF